jgi:hypothetical protein
MLRGFVPMLHVTDVQATLDWYRSIGFEAIRSNEVDGQVDWVLMSLGSSQVMFNGGGKMCSETRRDVDLYVRADSVAAIRRHIDGKAELLEDIHDTRSMECVSSRFVTSMDSGSHSVNRYSALLE